MPKKILVVDDDMVVIRLLESFLVSKGHEVSVAMDGIDALLKIKNENPDLVILDIVLPEINGYDICYQLRFNNAFEKIPILLLTERQREIDDSISQRVNIEYLSKPVNLNKINEKIELLLSAT